MDGELRIHIIFLFILNPNNTTLGQMLPGAVCPVTKLLSVGNFLNKLFYFKDR